MLACLLADAMATAAALTTRLAFLMTQKHFALNRKSHDILNSKAAVMYIQRCKCHRHMASVVKPLLAKARAALRDEPVYLFVRLSVYPKTRKTQFSQKLSNLELWSLLTTNRKSYMGFSKNPLLNSKNSRWRTAAIIKIVSWL